MKESRSRLWVDPYQSKLFLRVVLYWIFYQFTLWNFLFAWRLMEEGKPDLWNQYRQFCLDYYPILLCFLLLVPVFAWDAVKFSHRLVGPLQRFRKTMRDAAVGKPVRHVKMREGDYLIELQNDFNALLTALSRRGAVTLEEPNPSPDAAEARERALQPTVTE